MNTVATALGVDIGGTKTAIGVVSFPAGEVVLEDTIPTNPSRPAEMVLDDIARRSEALAAQARERGKSISGIGVGICELVDPNGEILSHNLLDMNIARVQARLSHIAPVTMEADVRAAARAEAMFGAGRPFRIFLYVTVGTGIACSLVMEGVPYLGARGATGTMASSPLSWSCERCGHVNNRTLEQIASGPALVERLNKLRPGSARSGPEVLAAAATGNRDAAHVVQTAGRTLESTVALLINVLDPEAVIIGGGLGLSEGPFWSSFVESTRAHVWSDVHRGLPILRGTTGLRAGVIGAALAALKGEQRAVSGGNHPERPE